MTSGSHGFKKNRYLTQHQKRGKPMTVCIAAICEKDTGSPKIVFCADRLITSGIQFEHGQPKIKAIHPGCFVMISSNNSLRADEIIENAKKRVLRDRKANIQNEKIEVILEILKSECESFYQNELEKQVLFKYGLEYKTFLENSKNLAPELNERITIEITQYSKTYSEDFSTDFLLLGLDPEPHIYTINEKGDHELHDFMGFAVIGSGYSLAFPELTKYLVQPNMPFLEGLVRVYEAKKVAQRVSGVGESTDLVVLHLIDGAPKYWVADQTVYKKLDEGREERKKTELQMLLKETESLQQMFQNTQQAGAETTKN